MWLAKQLEPKSQINPETVFGLKCVIMKVIKFAFCVTVRVLNPRMELYMIRLAIGIMRKIALMPNSRVMYTEEDLKFLNILLTRLVKVSQLFPLWNLPSVSISEAVMLNIITKKFHCGFILGLQNIDKEQCPVTSRDLKYQLYENDLRCLLSLKNSTDCRARAMEELLIPKSWSWSDVIHTMSSDLTPRSLKYNVHNRLLDEIIYGWL